MTLIPSLRHAALCMALAAAGASALAQPAAPVEVQDAWVRAAVPGQSGTGAFMKLTAHAWSASRRRSPPWPRCTR